MKIAVGSDHRGTGVKTHIIDAVRALGHEAEDCGANTDESVDYPDYASRVAQAVSDGTVDRGILICGTGIGMCIVANKFDGVRAAPVHDDLTAQMSRQHNDANIVCLSADLIGEQVLDRLIEIWLKTEFEGGRHQRRLDKISDIETSRNGRAE